MPAAVNNLQHENLSNIFELPGKDRKFRFDTILSLLFKNGVDIIAHQSGHTLHRHPAGIGDSAGKGISRHRETEIPVEFVSRSIRFG